MVANLLLVVPFVLLAGPVIGLFYGDQFDSAVAPAQVLVIGMLLGSGAGVASGYLYGRGRPGLNSWALGLGLAATVVLDILLIPPLGVMGAAIASTTTYLLADLALIVLLLRVSRPARHATAEAPAAVQVPS